MTPKQFRWSMAELPEITGNTFWDRIRGQIRELSEFRDPNSLLEWSPLLLTTNIGPTPPYLDVEKSLVSPSYLDKIDEWLSKHPDGYLSDTLWANLIHQLVHVCKWESVSGKSITDLNNVLEIGGGFGQMRLLFSILHPELSSYVICDLPELCLVQQYFLEQVGSNVNQQWVQTPIGPFDLTIACWSISEIESLQVRERILKDIQPNSYLIAHQGRWENGFDNCQWISDLSCHTKLNWHREKIEYLGGDNFYAIGY